ncbi:MAG: hypothetical protein LBO02_01165 [Holosporaceae bacterium]|jgi:NADH:ubiquinone oxidoreductase subunit 2 (subunit N)|nr:hypothetical protein [Holosporaceae bacterium]
MIRNFMPELLLAIYVMAVWFLNAKREKSDGSPEKDSSIELKETFLKEEDSAVGLIIKKTPAIHGQYLIFIAAIFACYLGDDSIKSGFFSGRYSESLLKSVLISGGLVISHLLQDESWKKQIMAIVVTLGSTIAISSNDFLSLFMAIELAAIPTYFLVCSDEPFGEKHSYLVFGIIGALLLLFGIGLIYFSTGATNFNDVRYAVSFASTGTINRISLFLISISFVVRLGIFPFNSWAFDLAQKQSSQTALVFCSLQTAMAIAFHKIMIVVFPHLNAGNIILATGLISVIFGNFLLIFQNNIKKIIACSVIGNAGSVLICCASPSYVGARGLVFSVISQIISVLGISVILARLKRSRPKEIKEIGDLNSLAWRHPFWALSVSLLFLSLMGFPPLLGFWGKVYICSSLMGEFFAIFYMASLVFNLICVSKILDALWFRENNDEFLLDRSSEKIICLTSFMTIAAIPFVHKILELLKAEIYFVH